MNTKSLPDFPPVCRDCGQPLKIEFQSLTHHVVTLHTCKNPSCNLRDVTLEDTALLHMSAERAEEYRTVNRLRGEVLL
jgi:hypothetical protein